MRFIDLSGKKFGRLTVIERVESKNKNTKWHCVCECGKHATVFGVDLKSGKTQSCGCIHSKQLAARNYKHGLSDSRLMAIWRGMKDRCNNPCSHFYFNYGGRGITVCDEWQNDFQAFHAWAMSHGYAEGLTIERIDNDKGYSPDNCRWATRKEQNYNKRSNHLITFDGKTQTITQWADEKNIKRCTLQMRLKRGWTIEKALNTP